MTIFQDPIKAENWLRTCEADKLRMDWRRYEEENEEPTEEEEDGNNQ